MKYNYLNIGCGKKYNDDWTNIDMVARGPGVIEHNLLEGIPFSENTFEVVYHSHVLEHFPKAKAKPFLAECFRILKKDGLIRIVLPDLEGIINEYQKWLKKNMENPDQESAANYDWIMLELFDQMVRNVPGGDMAQYFRQDEIINEEYVIDRIGFVGRQIRKHYLQQKKKQAIAINNKTVAASRPIKKPANSVTASPNPEKSVPVTKPSFLNLFKRKAKPEKKPNIQEPRQTMPVQDSQAHKIGKFRLGGEIHMWMYDRYSLPRLLREVGFKDVQIKDPHTSDIPNWSGHALDVKDGLAYDPTSLFVEARK